MLPQPGRSFLADERGGLRADLGAILLAALLVILGLTAVADEIYRRDGGRDLPGDEHPRTRAQREFDAAYELLCGVTARPDGTTGRVPDQAGGLWGRRRVRHR